MHKAGLLHKDLKPDNIFLDGRAFWGDFDFTIKEADVALGRNGIPDPLYERKKILKGNDEYAAPETYVVGKIDQKSEVYSLGLILYGLFMGIPPLAVREIGALIDDGESLDFTYENFREWLPWENTPPEDSLDYLLGMMMWPKPEDRYSLEKAYEEFLKIPAENLVLAHVIESEKLENFC
jgi:serine/threonine protein kinase